MQSSPQPPQELSSSSATKSLAPIPIPPHSHTSSSSLDSGVFSLVSSQEHQSLRNALHNHSETEEHEAVFLTGSLSPGAVAEETFTLSLPNSRSSSGPQQQLLTETQPPLSPAKPSTTTRYQAVYPQPLPIQAQVIHSHSRSRSWSKKGPGLPTLPELQSLAHELETLNKEFEETVMEFRSHSLSSLSGEHTPPQTPPSDKKRSSKTKKMKKRRTHKRNHSDGDSLSSLTGCHTPPQIPPQLQKTKPDTAEMKKTAKTHKRTYSDGSITINVNYQTVYYIHHHPSSPSLDRGSDENMEREQVSQGTTISTTEDDDNEWNFVQEDLTRKELAKIADEINPDRACRLCLLLHHSTHVWTELSQAHPPLTPRDKIFSILERWFENVSEGPENRKTLANACRRVEQRRVASHIARKSYVRS